MKSVQNKEPCCFKAGTVAETEIDVSEYAISEEAFNFAVEQEIEDAEQAAFEARVTARTLANDDLAARYMKAKSQVKCERYENGWRSWYFKGKNRAEWELNRTKAAACLTRYGLSGWEFALFHDAEVAVVESAGIDETAFDLLPKTCELNDIYEASETYTLTVYATEDFKRLYGGDILVRNFDTCWKLYDSGKHVIFTNSRKLERGGKTIATGDGIKDFCRFINCEFDVSERLAEIADAGSVNMEICGEHVYFRNGKFVWVMSPKYHAGFHAEAGIDGNDHYDIFTADKTGKFTRGNFVTEEEFFNVMVERGGCTIEVDAADYAVSPDAQDSAIVAEIKSPEFAQYLRDEAQREYEYELLAAFGEEATSVISIDEFKFKRYGSFKPKAAHIDATLQAKTFKPALCKEMFAQGHGKFVGKIEVGSYAEAMALIENVANDRFELDSEHKRNYFDKDGKFVEYCSREFKNVGNQKETFIFSEHFKNGELTGVEFQKDFSFSYNCKCVEILIKPAPPEVKTTAPKIDKADDFTSRMAELTVDLKEANDACTEACKLREMKRKEYNDACEAVEDAEILVSRKREAIAKFGQTCAKDLDEKLIDDTLIFSPTKKITDQAGGTCETDFEQIEIFFHDSNLTFYVSTDWLFLGEYDTPAQVEAVILELKAAIKRGDKEFTFPTVEDLSGTETSKITA